MEELFRAHEETPLDSVVAEQTAREGPGGADTLNRLAGRLEAVYHALPLAMVVLSLEGCIELWNPAAERIFGWQPEEVADWPLSVLLAGDFEGLRRLLAAALAGEATTGVALSWWSRGGARVDTIVSVAPLQEAPGHISGILVLMADVTAQQRLEARRVAAYRIAVALSRAGSIHDLCYHIHAELSTVLDAGNIYLAYYDPDQDLVIFPYFRDEHYPFSHVQSQHTVIAKKPGRGVTEYVMRTGRSQLLDGPAVRALAARGEIDLSECGPLPRVWLGVPLKTGGRVIGLIAVQSYTRGDAYTPDDLECLELISGQIAAVIERKRVEDALRQECRKAEEAYHREHRIATRFQSVLLPPFHAQIAGYEVAHAYHPALVEADVGGDFFNVFRIDEHRLGLVIGDVGGKGLEAAVVAARVQHSIVALAVNERRSPATVLDAIRRVISAVEEADLFVSVFFAILERATGRLCFACAGHELPLLWRASVRRAFFLPADGPALCGILAPPHVTQETTLEPGDLLLLYTDGLPDARPARGTPPLGVNALPALLAAFQEQSVAALTEAMCQEAIRFSAGQLRDDVAVLAIRRHPAEGGDGPRALPPR